MRRSAVGFWSLAVAGVTGMLLASSEFTLYNVFEWFGVSFESVAEGTKLSAKTGVKTVDGKLSGAWTVPGAAASSAVVIDGGVHYMNIYSPGLSANGPVFTTTDSAFAGGGDAYRIDCSTYFPITDSLPTVPTDVKSAMAVSARDGGLSFYGYGANGWVPISDSEVQVSTAICYDQRAEFRRIDGVLYVTYSIKSGNDYIELKDSEGNVLIPAANQGAVRIVEFRGIANMKSLEGSRLKSSASPADVAAPGYPMALADWFNVLMGGVDVGTVLDADTGVIDESGSWDVPYTGFTAEVADDEGEHYLSIEQTSTGMSGPNFTAVRESAYDRSEVQFSMRFTKSESVLDTSLESKTKAAMTMADSKNADGETVTSFYGYAKDGWVKLGAAGVNPQYNTWYDLMATFHNDDGVLYASYYVNTYYGYLQLVDEDGNGRFVTAGSGKSPVQFANVLGDTDVRFMTGTDLTFNPDLTYYWIGGESGIWAERENWSHTAGGTPASDYPRAGDSAIVNNRARIDVEGADANVSNLVVNATLTLSGDRKLDFALYGGTYGSGHIVLQGANFRSGAAKEVSLGCDLEIAEGTENKLINYNDGSVAYQLKFSGKLTGSGTLIFTEATGEGGSVANGGGIRLLGDTSEFRGTAKFVYTNPRAKVAFESVASSDNRESYWSLFDSGTVPSPGTGEADTGFPQFPFKESGRTYRFGALSGNIPAFKTADAATLVKDIVLEVGEQVSSNKYTVGGDWVNADAGRTVRWLGKLDAVLNYGIRNTTLLEIAGGGKVDVSSAEAIPECIAFRDNGGFLLDNELDLSAAIHNSTAPIGVEVESGETVWETALDSSNIGGLTKKGEGTLKLTKVPHYTGVTRVEAGILIVPYGTALGQLEIADGAELVIDLTGVSSDVRFFFAAASSEGGLKGKHRFSPDPPPVDLPDALWTDGGGVIYSWDTHVYTWTGKADDGGLWSTPLNWAIGGVAATQPPGDYDVVKVPVTKPLQQIVVDMPANVWSITCEEGVRPFRFVSPAITNTNYAIDDTSVLTTGSGILPGLVGVGGFKTSESVVFNIAAGETNRFIGPLSATTLVKSGEGEAIIAGTNVFAAISLEGGVLRLANHVDLDNLRMDFDASVGSTFKYADGEIEEWKSREGEYSFKFSEGVRAQVTTNYFDGAESLFLRPTASGLYSRYHLTSTNESPVGTTRSLFILYHAVNIADYAFIYSSEAVANYALHIRGTGESHLWENLLTSKTDGIYTGTGYGSEVIANGSRYLTSWLNTDFGDISSGTSEYLGTSGTSIGAKAAIAAVVGFTRSLTHAERLAVQRAMMMKWGILDNYDVLPSTAAMTMQEGATLDLGGLIQTVASFTGAGTVTNGLLATVNAVVTEDGGALTIPAVGGTTYNLMKHKAELILLDGEGAAVTVVVPDGCTSGRVFCEGAVDWKVTDPGITIQGPDAGWYTIINTGGGSCIIVR